MKKPLNVEQLLAFDIPETRDEYDPREVILYALGVGAGLDPQVNETAFVFERDLQVLPTMALVLGTPGFWPMDPRTGLDFLDILHAEQRLKLHRSLEPAGTLVGNTRITHLADKGSGRPALIRAEKQVRTLSGVLVAEAEETWLVQGAGGFGGERDLPGDPLPPAPDRDPDYEVILPTSPAQAAIYRLSGDRNPLHIDPASAQSAGFDRPILHGLSTMGLVGRALIHACCGGIAGNLREIAARFTAPIYPGDTIRTLVWQDGETVHFRAFSVERGQCVIDNGLAEVSAAGFSAAGA